MSGRTEGLARSIHTRLVDYGKERGLDPTLVFTRYALERFLYRLGRSSHSHRFVLKGAALLNVWLGETGRATRDVDLLGLGDLSDEALVELIADVCRQSVDADGMRFDVDTISATFLPAEDRPPAVGPARADGRVR